MALLGKDMEHKEKHFWLKMTLAVTASIFLAAITPDYVWRNTLKTNEQDNCDKKKILKGSAPVNSERIQK